MVNEQQFRFRFYENEYPEVDDYVVVKIVKVDEYGFVTLLEYNNIEGMIQARDASRYRIKSLPSVLPVGKIDVMQVIRVNKEKGYIDLSKKYITEDDHKTCMENFAHSKTINSIIKHVAVSCGIPVMEMMETVVWPMYERCADLDPPKHAIEGFKELLSDQIPTWQNSIPESVFKSLRKEIALRLAEKIMTFNSIIEVNCFNEHGIDAIKAALICGRKTDFEDIAVSVSYLGPKIRLSVQSFDEQQGIAILSSSISRIQMSISNFGGNLTIHTPPTANP